MNEPADYCADCFALFKALDACPKTDVFNDAALLPKLLQVIWVSASVLPWLIYIGLFLCVLFARTSRVLFLAFSLLIQQCLNDVILKHIFAQDRPDGACSISYGMPSGHSAFTASWTLLLVLEWLLYHNKVPFKTGRFHGVVRTFGIIVMPLVPISRHYLNYHTIEQILCGLLTGLVVTSMYFYTMMAFMHRDNGKIWGTKVTKIFKRLKVKDNIVLFGAQIEEMMMNQPDLESQLNDGENEESTTPLKDNYMVLPLRRSVRYFFWKKELKLERVDSNEI